MGIKLPRLTWDLDCGEMTPEYKGLIFTYWLNPPHELGQQAEETSEAKKGRKPWETPFLRTLELVLDRVTVPAELTDDEDESEIVIENPSAEDIYKLQREPGFDPQILVWATAQYQTRRIERLKVEVKN